MSYRKLIVLVTLVLFSVIIQSCSNGGGAGPNAGGTVAGFDGTYNCTGTAVTPAGTTTGSGSFDCLHGYCADSSGAFSGTVDGNGTFSGTDIVCQGCNPLAMSGQFSATSVFTISGHSGGVSQTFSCRCSGCSGGGPGGGRYTGPHALRFYPCGRSTRHGRYDHGNEFPGLPVADQPYRMRRTRHADLRDKHGDHFYYSRPERVIMRHNADDGGRNGHGE